MSNVVVMSESGKNEIALVNSGIEVNVDKSLYPAVNVPSTLKDIVENNPVNSSPLMVKAIKDRYCYLPVKSIEDKNESAEQIDKAINVMLADRGFNMEQADIEYLKLSVIRTIQSTPKFSNLTLKEIREAFHKGVRGEFGEYMGINVVNLESWLNKYIELYMNRAIGEYQKANSKIKSEMDDEITREAWIASMDRQFQKTKKGEDEFRDFRQWLFIFCQKHELVDWKKFEKEENKRIRSEYKKEYTLMRKAEQMVVSEETLSCKRKKKVATFERRQILQSELDHVREAIGSAEYKGMYKLKNRVEANFRSLMVKAWIRTLIEEGKELKELLENAGD